MNLIKLEKLTMDSIYDELEACLEKQHQIDISEAIEDGDPEEVLNIEGYYDMYYSKLRLINEIKELDINKQQDYLKTLAEIDNLNVDNKQKLMMMLSYGVLESYTTNISKKTLEEKSIISATLSVVDVEDYDFYYPMVSDITILNTIKNKTNDLYEQVNLESEVMSIMDNYDSDYIESEEDAEELVNASVNVINSINLGKTR